MSHLVFDLIAMQRGGQSSLGGMDYGGNGSWLPSNAASSSKVGGIKTKKPEAWGGDNQKCWKAQLVSPRCPWTLAELLPHFLGCVLLAPRARFRHSLESRAVKGKHRYISKLKVGS